MWYVIVVQSNSERIALEEMRLENDAIECYAPMMAVVYKNRRLRKPVVLLRFMFPGYVFVRGDLSAIYQAVTRARHCFRLLEIDRVAIPVAASVVEALREGEQERRRAPIDTRRGVMPGATVRLTGGPFLGYLGVVLTVRRQAVDLALHVKGKIGYRVTVPDAQIEVVNQTGQLTTLESNTNSEKRRPVYSKGFLSSGET
jgi:transcription antitermination factor NusG